jgi:hypothetical protein
MCQMEKLVQDNFKVSPFFKDPLPHSIQGSTPLPSLSAWQRVAAHKAVTGSNFPLNQ